MSRSLDAASDSGRSELNVCVMNEKGGRTIIILNAPVSLSLPLDYTAIERILPHRYPFLLVDRVTELEPDKRIVGIKNVSLNERYLSYQPGEPPALPPTLLTDAVAQGGAILMLSKPENRHEVIIFIG